MLQEKMKRTGHSKSEARNNRFKNILGIFFAPKPTLARVIEQRNWLVPLVLFLMIVLVFEYFTLPLREQTRNSEILIATGKVSAENQMLLQDYGTFAAMMGTVSGRLVSVLMLTLLLCFLSRIFLGQKQPFKTFLSIFSYSSLILALGLLIKLPLILLTRRSDIFFNLSAFLSGEPSGAFILKILKSFEVFSIWQFVILTIGIMLLYKVSVKKAGLVIIFLFLIYISFSIAIAINWV